MIKKLLLTNEQEAHILAIMEASHPSEHGMFCLVRQYRGDIVFIDEILESPQEAWSRQGEHFLTPTTQWLSAIASRAQENNLGLMFLHSHPNALHPAGLSAIDRQTSENLGRTLGTIIDGPFLSGVIHQSGWRVEHWDGNELIPIPAILSIGEKLFVLNPLSNEETDLDSRQQTALGPINGMLRRLEVAIVGCGGIGSQVAVHLARMGVGTLVLIDNDVIDTQSNVRRMSGTKLSDFNEDAPESKVKVIGDYIDSLGLGTAIQRVREDVRSPEVVNRLRSVDVVISCTDTHSSRAALNFLPFQSGVPIIDAGSRVSSKMDGELAGLWSDIRVIMPTSVCLNCRGIIDPRQVAAENLPAHVRDQSIRDGYVTGEANAPEPSVLCLTSSAAGHAISALVAMLSKVKSPEWYRVEEMTAEVVLMQIPEPRSGCICGHGLQLTV